MKKEVLYSEHLRFRIKVRNIDPELPRQIFYSAQEVFFDAATGNEIAVATSEYFGKTRELAVVFNDQGDKAVLITVHPLKPGQKDNRIASGRWAIR